MDNLRGTFDTGLPADDSPDWDSSAQDTDTSRDTENVRELPPEAIGQDERRMQVRAYNHWASLLCDATFPSIEDLEPNDLPDFGPSSVLLDFSTGIDDPVVQYLGDKLAAECGAEGHIERLSDVPPRSLLSRITDHYMQILANQAPIGFEAEFVNQRGNSILYRGILLPFSSDDETIDFIYGVINWKEMADAATADELLLEIDQAIDADTDDADEVEDQPHKHHADPVTDWADSPAHEPEATGVSQTNPLPNNVASLSEAVDGDVPYENSGARDEDGLPVPDFGQYHLDEPEVDEYGDEIEEEEDGEGASYSFASLTDYIEAPEKKAVDLDADHFDPDDYQVDPVEETQFDGTQFNDSVESPAEPDDVPAAIVPAEPVRSEPVITELPADADMHDCLASARELALNASASEDRSREALYAAVGRAYDFSLAAKAEPEAYNELIENNGLSVQDRAPMTPIVKLVFGQDYDKTRLTEYATVLTHAHRHNIARGSLATYLADTDGGLKGVVGEERRLRREESGKEPKAAKEIREQLAKKLRELEELTLEAVSHEGPEFTLVMLRRDGEGKIAMIGEVDDVSLVERAGKKLVG